MDRIETLMNEVDDTLRRARARTNERGGTPKPASRSTRASRERVGSIVEALDRQRSICASLRQEVEDVRSQREEAERAVKHAMEQREGLEQDLEIVANGIDLTRRRRRETEKRAGEQRERLAGSAQERREASFTVAETKEALERLSSRLKSVV